DSRDPFAGPVDPDSFAKPMEVDLGGLRVAVSDDLGFCPVDKDIRAVFRKKVAAFKGLFRECAKATPDFGEADPVFDVLRAVGYLSRFQKWYAQDPAKLGPNTRANYELASSMSLADFSWAHSEQTAIYRRVQAFFKDYDLLITPTTPVTPFSWEQLYATHMN